LKQKDGNLKSADLEKIEKKRFLESASSQSPSFFTVSIERIQQKDG
jgi:hypothetical protein